MHSFDCCHSCCRGLQHAPLIRSEQEESEEDHFGDVWGLRLRGLPRVPFLRYCSFVSATGRLEYVFAVVGDIRFLRRVIPVLSDQTALMQELVTGNCSVEVTCLSGARVFLAWVVRLESLRNGRARQQQLVCSLNHLLFEYCLRYSSGKSVRSRSPFTKRWRPARGPELLPLMSWVWRL